MAHVLLFHHAQGLTDGVRGFADQLRHAGHTVHTPDLFAGKTFDSVEAGVAHAESIGFLEIAEMGGREAQHLPAGLVYGGFSLGILPAQKLAQTRSGALGALLYHDAVPSTTFDAPWPGGVALQIHVSEDDPWADPAAAQELHQEVAGSELFLYPGDAHLFADPGSVDFDPGPAALLLDRTMTFLDRIG